MPKARRKKEQPKPFSSWWCETCNSAEMNHDQIMEHVRIVHGATGKLSGTKKMIVHLDGDTWYSSAYEIQVTSVMPPVNLRHESLNLSQANEPLLPT